MNSRLSIYILLIVTAILLLACEPKGCFEKRGPQVSEEIHVDQYSELSVYGMFETILVPDTTDYVEFVTRESILPQLSAKVEEDILILHNSFDCFYQRDFSKVKAYIHYSGLQKINLYEPCLLTTDYPIENTVVLVVQAEMAEVDIEISAERFHFYNHRTTGGKFTFRGSVDYSSISGYYTAQFNLDKFEARHLKLNNSSIGDMYANARDKLEVQIHHRGNIYYTGNPEIVIDSISGSGQLIHFQ
jgi:hypothetical protein